MFEMSSPPQSAAEHVDVTLSQINPENESHPLVPQIQPAVFGSFPLIFVHSGADRQRQGVEEEQDVVEEDFVL